MCTLLLFVPSLCDQGVSGRGVVPDDDDHNHQHHIRRVSEEFAVHLYPDRDAPRSVADDLGLEYQILLLSSPSDPRHNDTTIILSDLMSSD